MSDKKKNEVRHCLTCGRTCLHNAMKEGFRCTFCGYPPTTNPGKSEHARFIIRQQANKRIKEG